MKTEDGVGRDEVAARLRLACMRVARRSRAVSGDTLAPQYYSMLTQLMKVPRTPRELAELESVSPPVITGHLKSLERLGYVERRRDPGDGRQWIVTATSAGVAARERARRDRDDWIDIQLDGLDDHEVDTLRAATELLEDILRGPFSLRTNRGAQSRS